MNDEKKQPQDSIFVGGPMAPAPDSPVDVVDVQFHTGAKIYYFDPDGITVNTGDHIIIETARGPEYGICAGGNHQVPFRDIVPPLRKVIRIATDADKKTLEANRSKEKRAFEICQQRIQEHKLDMQLVSAEYAFDGSKILFFFTADDRVDFRELVKNLASIFRTRIELRQIGVRDKAKMVGGLGICGRPFCCTEFLDDFQPVSIKMAKTQNLSLNPTKISGTCGRLMCCLKYEQDAYEDLLKTSPKMDSFVDTPGGRGTVVDVNLLRQSVRVRMETQPDTIETYQNSEIAVLRSGKAKKNDAPIPADLAPISGGGRRPQAPVEPEADEPMRLDPIRFRYRPDDIVEETETEEVVEEPEEIRPAPVIVEPTPETAPKQPSRRKRDPRGPKPEAPKAEAPKAPEAAAQEGDAPAQKNRRNKPDRKPKAQKPEQDNPEAPAKETAEPKQGQKPRNPRNRKPRNEEGKEKAQEPKPAQEQKAPQEQKENRAKPKPPKPPKERREPAEPKPAEPKPENTEGGESGERKPRRNNYHHRRPHKPGKPQGGGEG